MVVSMFPNIQHLSFIKKISKKWHRLASTASDRKYAKIQHDIFHDSTKHFFSKHQNKAEFKDLDHSEVLSSDFPVLRTSAASMTSTASTTSIASMTSTASFHQILYWSWWLHHPWHPSDQIDFSGLCNLTGLNSPISSKNGLIIPGTKMANTGPFLWNGSSKIQFFTDIWYILCQRLLRPASVTFLNFFWWKSNGGYLGTC